MADIVESVKERLDLRKKYAREFWTSPFRGFTATSIILLALGLIGIIANVFGSTLLPSIIIWLVPGLSDSVALLASYFVLVSIAVLGLHLKIIERSFDRLLLDVSASLSSTLSKDFGKPKGGNNLFEQVGSLGESVRVVQDAIEANPSRLRILLFGRLMAYTPVIVAKHEGYFKDMGLDVELEFEDHDSDEDIANAVIEKRADFGVCDPFAALRVGLEHGESLAGLRIVAPVTKQLGATVLVNSRLVVRGAQIAIDAATLPNRTLKIAAFARPSTSWTLALHLERDLKRNFPRTEVELCEVPICDVRSFAEKVSGFHFVISWQPLTEFLVEGANGIAAFQELTEGHLTQDGAQDRAWIAEGPKAMGSALITRTTWADRNPILLKRVRISLMLATMRLEALTAPNARADQKLIRAISSEIFCAEDGADEKLIAASLDKTLRHARIGRDSLFPFFRRSLPEDMTENYLDHLESMIRFWNIEENASAAAARMPKSKLKNFFVSPS